MWEQAQLSVSLHRVHALGRAFFPELLGSSSLIRK